MTGELSGYRNVIRCGSIARQPKGVLSETGQCGVVVFLCITVWCWCGNT